MKIAHVSATFPPYYAGTGMVCYFNALALTQLGHDVTVYTARSRDRGPDAGLPTGQAGLPFPVRRMACPFRVGNAPLTPELLWMEDCQLIHLHYPFMMGAELTYVHARWRGVPYVLTYHNDLLSYGFRKPLFALYNRLFLGKVVKGASRVLAVSLDHFRSSRAYLALDMQLDRVQVLPNGVDVQRWNPEVDGALLRRSLGLDAETKVLLFSGALDKAHYFKGLPYLLQSLALFRQPAWHLLVVGDGDLRREYARQVGDLGLGERVHFLGTIPHQELPPYYAAADLVVLPSTPPESFGLVLIEAMACAKPVIASDIPGVRTVVDHGENGLLVQPGDVPALAQALETLLGDDALREQMGQKGRKKAVQQYAWERVGTQLEGIYREVLEESPRVEKEGIRR